jgi:hypothetical protein
MPVLVFEESTASSGLLRGSNCKKSSSTQTCYAQTSSFAVMTRDLGGTQRSYFEFKTKFFVSVSDFILMNIASSDV